MKREEWIRIKRENERNVRERRVTWKEELKQIKRDIKRERE